MQMRVLFASTQSTGHFAPLVPFAQACRDAGHEVLVAGPPQIAELAYRAALAYAPVGAAAPERLDEVSRMMAGRAGFERIAIATTELFVGSHARAALPDMLRAGRGLAAGRDRPRDRRGRLAGGGRGPRRPRRPRRDRARDALRGRVAGDGLRRAGRAA